MSKTKADGYLDWGPLLRGDDTQAAVGLWRETFWQDYHCSRGGVAGAVMPSHKYEAGKYARPHAVASLLSTPGVQTSGHHTFHNLKGKTVMCDQEPRGFNSGSSDKCPNFSELSCLSTSWGQKSPPCTVA